MIGARGAAGQYLVGGIAIAGRYTVPPFSRKREAFDAGRVLKALPRRRLEPPSISSTDQFAALCVRTIDFGFVGLPP